MIILVLAQLEGLAAVAGVMLALLIRMYVLGQDLLTEFAQIISNVVLQAALMLIRTRTTMHT